MSRGNCNSPTCAKDIEHLRAENKAALDNRNEATEVWIQSDTQCRAYANQLEAENAALRSQLARYEAALTRAAKETIDTPLLTDGTIQMLREALGK